MESIEEIKATLDTAYEFCSQGKHSQALDFAQTALLSAEQISHEELSCRALLLLAQEESMSGNTKQAMTYAEKALMFAERCGIAELKAETYGKMGLIYEDYSDFIKAAKYAQLSLKLWEYLDNKEKIAITLGSLGRVSYWMSDYVHALEYYQKSVELSEANNFRKPLAIVLGNIGLVYCGLSDFSLSLEYHQRALTINEELGDKEFIAINLGNIGIVYFELQDFHRALEYYQKTLSMQEELGLRDKIAKNLGNIGNVYYSLKEYDTSLEYIKKAVAIFEELELSNNIALNIENLGYIYMELGDYTLAFQHFQQALALWEQLGILSGIGSATGIIGILYSNSNFEGYDITKAEEYLWKALDISVKLGTKKSEFELNKELAELYVAQNQWKKAYHHFEKFHSMKESVLSEETKKQIERFAIERDVAVLRREQEVLKIKNVELEDLNHILEDKNHQLSRLNIEKNEFLGIAAHDLKNPLNAITMLASILSDESETLKAEEIKEFATDIRNSSQQMFDLIINLLDYNKIEQGNTLAPSEKFSVLESIHSVAERFRQQASKKRIELMEELEEISIFGSRATFEQVLDNIVSNAIKFSPYEKRIHIKSETKNGKAIISVRDEGPGMTASDKQKLFGKFVRLSAKPTGGEHSTGLGLSIVKKLVEAMNGKVWCESELGKGATFFVELPII